jgi:hypothetical protein
MAPSLLDLTTDQERPTVTIDGVPYPLRLSSDLGLLDYHHLMRAVPRFFDLCGRGPKITERESLELSALSKQLCTIALPDVPTDVDARLGDVDRVMIFKVFTERLSPRVMQAMSALQVTASRRNGKPSSPGSNGSTGATRRRGGRSRSASSGRTST